MRQREIGAKLGIAARHCAMATFDGRIREYPGIAVDNMGGDAQLLYLLSHVHADHIRGLSGFAGSRIYCSAATRTLLLGTRVDGKRVWAHLESVLTALAEDVPHLLPVGTETVSVTLLPAAHCLGSVMFLIRGSRGTVLHTGDMRAEAWFCRGIGNTVLSTLRDIDTVYLDTTFCSARARHLPTRKDAIADLVAHLAITHADKEKQKCTPVYIATGGTVNYEDIFRALCLHFKQRVHVDSVKRYAGVLFDDGEPVADYITDNEATWIHACVPPCAAAANALAIVPTAMWFVQAGHAAAAGGRSIRVRGDACIVRLLIF